MKTDQSWSRRRFSKAVVSAQLLLASGALTLPLSCAKTKKPLNKSILDNSQQETLKLAMDEIIPANEKMPSASQVGGVTYILEILEELPDLTPLFEAFIIEANNVSISKFDVDFSRLNNEECTSVLKLVEQNKIELFKVLLDFTYESYYTNEKIYQLIGYKPYSTGSLGPKMEPFDEKLLDRVKNLPPMYTKI